MQPNQNPYDFILNSGQQYRPDNKKKRILLVAVIGAVLLVVFMVVFSLLFSGGKGSAETLLTVAQQQTELIRVAEDGTDKARGPLAQNLAITTKLSVASAQKDLLEYMKKQRLKAGPKQLALGRSDQTDAALTAAEQNNRYDEEFTKIIEQQLAAYQASLQTAFNQTSSKAGKDLLSAAYTQAGLLLSKPQ